MKRTLALLCLLCTWIPARAELPDFDQVFRAAATAYDQEDFGEAVRLYRTLLDQGVESKAVQFNLGNSLYRTGDLGHAVVAYRRAWRLAPRDPDILANLQFVMNETSAVTASDNPVVALARRVSLPEWWILATTSWGLLWVALGAAAIHARRRSSLLRVAFALLMLSGISGFGIYQWSRVVEAREMVVTEPGGVQALYAPLADAEAHFELPTGSILTLREQANAWLKVSIDGRDGWIREDSVTPVGRRQK